MRTMAEMPYHMGLKVKLYPSDAQKHLIAVNDGAARSVYNHLVACGNERWRLSKSAGMVPVFQERLDYLSSVSQNSAGIKNAISVRFGSG